MLEIVEIPKDKPEIALYDTEEAGFIILYPSGVYYSNQAGGYACLQPFEEGVYVPANNLTFNIGDKLTEYFTGAKWKGCCMNGIDNEDADFIDELMKECYPTRYLTVNRERLSNSVEAWIYVKGIQPEESAPVISGFGEFEAVLTWLNSD
jgi:hypothetical protein